MCSAAIEHLDMVVIEDLDCVDSVYLIVGYVAVGLLVGGDGKAVVLLQARPSRSAQCPV